MQAYEMIDGIDASQNMVWYRIYGPREIIR